MDHSVEVREHYCSKFYSAVADSISRYRDRHQHGTSMELSDIEPNWLSDDCRTRQSFPGRLLLRPSVGFESSLKAENTAGCPKMYCKSDSHSPVVFIVQCCCRYPNLYVFPVMSEC